MKIEPKYTFEDLNCFVDGRLTHLRNTEEIFWNQVLGNNENLEYLVSTNTKLQILSHRLLNLKLQQDITDCILNQIEEYQKQWQGVLGHFETLFQNLGTLHDTTRTVIYKLTEKIFTNMSNCYEVLEDLESKIMKYNIENKQEPIYLICEIMNRNLSLLEKLYIYIEKLQRLVNCSDYYVQKHYRRGFF